MESGWQRATSFQLLFQVAPHRQNIGDQTQEADGAGNACESACPGGEFRPIRQRQAEKLANDRQRQRPRIAIDDIGRASFGKQFAGKFVRNGTVTKDLTAAMDEAEKFVDRTLAESDSAVAAAGQQADVVTGECTGSGDAAARIGG